MLHGASVLTGSCQRDTEHSGGGEGFLNQLNDYKLLKKYSVPWSWRGETSKIKFDDRFPDCHSVSFKQKAFQL
jgi:hypothetical protein